MSTNDFLTDHTQTSWQFSLLPLMDDHLRSVQTLRLRSLHRVHTNHFLLSFSNNHDGQIFYFQWQLALTPPSAAGARPAALRSLRSLLRGLRPLFGHLRPTAALAEKHKIFILPKNFEWKKNLKSAKKFLKNFEKKKKKMGKFFFFRFSEIFSRRNLSYDE